MDGVFLGLHGAMVAHGYDDTEGDVVERIRAQVGPQCAIGMELDPHCHLTVKRVRLADLIVLYKEFPHTDVIERAEDLLTLMLRTIRGEIRPVMALYDCRQIGTYSTRLPLMRAFVDKISAMEGKDGVLSISIAHGFPWGDVADMGTRVLVMTDDRRAAGEALAERLGAEIIAFRDRLMPAFPNADDAIADAVASNAMPVVLADSADNPGGGAGGDSTYILARLIARGVDNAVLGPLWDPVAVQICFEAGVGARLPLRIGGKVGPASGAPIDAMVEVLALKRDAMQAGLSNTMAPLGDTAVIAIGGIKVVMITRRSQAFGTDLFTQFGIDLTETRLVVVKSSQHFHAKYGPVAKKVIYVDTPGSCPIDFSTVPYAKARKTLWMGPNK